MNRNMKKMLQLTVAVIKPHITKVPLAIKDIRKKILSHGFYVVRSKRLKMSQQEAEMFYKEHCGKFFYNRLITFMCSGPIDVHVLACEDAIQRWRDLMGPTKVYKAIYSAPSSIRATHGLSDTRNATHGSDSPVSAEREIKFFFPDFNIDKWYQDEEPHFRSGNIKFYPKWFLHKVHLRR